MFKRLVFSIVATLLLVAGTLALAPAGVKADPGFSPAPLAATSAISIDTLLLDVKIKCGNWNNWCGSGTGSRPFGAERLASILVPSIEKWLSSSKAIGHAVTESKPSYTGKELAVVRESAS